MTARALGVKWVGRGERGEFAICNLRFAIEEESAVADSESNDARATAPKPLAQRKSISRRLSGRGMKRLQCIFQNCGTGASPVALQGHGRGAHATLVPA